MYCNSFEEYLERVDKRIQWILMNAKKIENINNKNKIAFVKQDEINADVVILNERYVTTKDNINKETYELFTSYSIISNELYNSANNLYRKQFFSDKNDFDRNTLGMKFYQEFKSSIFENIQCDFEKTSKEELRLRETFLNTPKCIRLGVIYDVSDKWYKFMESCYRYYKKEIDTIPSIPRNRKGKNRRNSFTINPDTIRVIPNKEYIHPTNRIKKSKYSKNSIINYRNILILPSQFGNIKIPTNCYKGNICEVRITPNRGNFIIDIKHKRQINLGRRFTKGIYYRSRSRIVGIDFGLNNLMAIASNTGSKPLLIKGKRLAKINKQYNILLEKCELNSKRYKRLNKRRKDIIYDILNKAVSKLMYYLEINQIGTLVLGTNDALYKESFLWPQDRLIHPNFKRIDYKYLIDKIKLECQKLNIDVKEIEDKNLSMIPTILDNQYNELFGIKKIESGLSRRHRMRLLRSDRFGFVNCDINSAINIIIRYKKNAFKYILNKIQFDRYISAMDSISKSDIEYIIRIDNLKDKRKSIKLRYRKNSIDDPNKLFGYLLKICDKNKAKVSIYSKNVTFNALKKSARKSMAFMFSPVIINL